MKLKDIKRDGFYSDGTNIYYKSKNDFIMFCKTKEGISSSYCFNLELEVNKVESNQTYYGGDIKVIDSKTIDLNATTYNYFAKQFADIEEAKKYALENQVDIFNIISFKEYVSVEFKKDTKAREITNYKDLK